MIDADHIVKGEGIAWLRGVPRRAIRTRPSSTRSFRRHSAFRLMGLPPPSGGGNPAATIIPSVGCPMGCNFCTTSAFFGGKGQVRQLLRPRRGPVRGHVRARSVELGAQTFFMMDENFLLYKKRALELLELHEARTARPWSLYVFSSANAIRKYDIRQLVELGRRVDLARPRVAEGAASYVEARRAPTRWR